MFPAMACDLRLHGAGLTGPRMAYLRAVVLAAVEQLSAGLPAADTARALAAAEDHFRLPAVAPLGRAEHGARRAGPRVAGQCAAVWARRPLPQPPAHLSAGVGLVVKRYYFCPFQFAAETACDRRLCVS